MPAVLGCRAWTTILRCWCDQSRKILLGVARANRCKSRVLFALRNRAVFDAATRVACRLSHMSRRQNSSGGSVMKAGRSWSSVVARPGTPGGRPSRVVTPPPSWPRAWWPFLPDDLARRRRRIACRCRCQRSLNARSRALGPGRRRPGGTHRTQSRHKAHRWIGVNKRC